MAKKNDGRKKQKQNPIVPLATGLLLIGISLIWLTLPNKSGAEAEQFSGGVLSVSFPAPQLSLENINGKPQSLADYRQKVVLVNNWATWCPPCKAEMPVLEAYYEDHAAEGFLIIAVEAGDAREAVSQFAYDYQLQFQVWLDPNGASLRAFGNGNLPNSYVIDRSGTARYTWTGEVNRTTLEKYVTPLLRD
jgi:thiol-disulfide isomerase/thioredoxin